MAVLALVVFAVISQRQRPVKSVDFKMIYPSKDTLVTKENLYKDVCQKLGTPEGVEIKNIDISAIEKVIEKNPFVADAEAFTTLRGDLVIKAIQRHPIVRISVRGERDFFLDDKGFSFFASKIQTPHVLVANGYIQSIQKRWKVPFSLESLKTDNDFQKTGIANIYKLALFIEKNPFLKAQIDQVYLNNDGEFELIPKIGEQVILLGNTENLDEKFKKLVALYQNGFSNLGWSLYSKINLKYKDQVVCVKK